MTSMTATTDQAARTGPRLLLTVPEAAAALAISRSKLYELLAAGTVPSIRIDGSRRVPVTGLQAYIAALLAEAA
jgi:excisionase family DNA binding protein